MIHIAMVEDDTQYRSQLADYLDRYAAQSGQQFQVSAYTDGDEIALNYKAVYDIILMDIEMTFMNGMMAAEEIRRHDSEVVIIFITNSPQYALKGYSVDALDYVLKPVSYFAFSQQLDRALARMKKRSKRFLPVPVRGGTHKLELSELYYVETRGRELVFHTVAGLLESSCTLKELEEKLGDAQFFRCNKGYLVNLEYVDDIRDDDAIVHGERVQLSRARKKAFMDALNSYINEVSK